MADSWESAFLWDYGCLTPMFAAGRCDFCCSSISRVAITGNISRLLVLRSGGWFFVGCSICSFSASPIVGPLPMAAQVDRRCDGHKHRHSTAFDSLAIGPRSDSHPGVQANAWLCLDPCNSPEPGP